MIEKIKHKIEKLEADIKPTIDNNRQFELNSKNKFLARHLTQSIAILEQAEAYIGKQVFKYKNGFSYSEFKSTDTDFLNQTEDVAVEFTQELFQQFKLDAVTYWIQYYSEDLTQHCIVSNSSSKLSNLRFEWELEMKQELIKFYKVLIGKY